MNQNPLVRHAVAALIYKPDHTIKQLVAVVELNDGVRRKFAEGTITARSETACWRRDAVHDPAALPLQRRPADLQNGKVDIKAVIKEVNQA